MPKDNLHTKKIPYLPVAIFVAMELVSVQKCTYVQHVECVEESWHAQGTFTELYNFYRPQQ